VRVVLVVLVVLGAALLGAAVWVESVSQPPGWFAYAPLSDTVYAPSRARWLGTGALLSGAGALLLGGVAGFFLGRRGQRPPSRRADF
jgi:heme/copper-type cytochrome/quinol oxidase subunit 1